MRVLLDTHIFVWAVLDSPRLTPQARAVLQSASVVFVSAASIWEIALKAELGRLSGGAHAMVGAIGTSGFRELAISPVHAAEVTKLPLYHKDPFDRVLIAQAISEPLRLVTTDKLVARYTDLAIRV